MPDLSNLMSRFEAIAASLTAQHLMMLGGAGLVLIIVSLVFLVRGSRKSELGVNATRSRVAPAAKSKSKLRKSDPFLSRLEKISNATA
ncbi:hypothetical protein [Celeribacter sp.]|uniref:hypothetical protein n=1 Tax=Celeribacter sp. TaxID=1890673 RepID=UPI003A92343C